MDKATIQRLFAQAHGSAYKEEPHNGSDDYHISLMFVWVHKGLRRCVHVHQFKDTQPIHIEASAAHLIQPLNTGWSVPDKVSAGIDEPTMLTILQGKVKEANDFTDSDLQKA